MVTRSPRIHSPSRRLVVPPRGLDRRGFLGIAAGSVFGALGAACTGLDSSAGPRPGGGAGGGGKADNLEFDENGVCLSGTTGDDALGPYWTSNVRQTNQLAAPDQIGQPMVIMGNVFARDCVTPVPGALIVAWQADDEGLYDYNHAGRNQGSAQGQLTTSQTNLRGLFRSSAAGTYSFETIFPSEYPLNVLDPTSSEFRAPHIHYAVFFTDQTGFRHQLVTQLYFEPNSLVLTKVPDLDALNANDLGASTAESSRFVEIDGGSTTDIWHGQFDIVLDVRPDRV